MTLKYFNLLLFVICTTLVGCAATDYGTYTTDVTIANDIKSIAATDGSYVYSMGKNAWDPRFGHQEGTVHVLKCWGLYQKSYNGKQSELNPESISQSYQEALGCGAKSVIVTLADNEKISGVLFYNPLPPKRIGSDYSIGPGGIRPIVTIPSKTLLQVKQNPENIYSVYETYIFKENTEMVYERYSWILWLSGLPFAE